MTAHTTERLNERLEAAKDNAVLQAQIWKMEALGANATIAEIYRLVESQAGNWRGAQPVRDYLAAHAAERALPVPRVIAHRIPHEKDWTDGPPGDYLETLAKINNHSIELAYSAPANAKAGDVLDVLDVDSLAQEIRRVDGNHTMGAGLLAECIMSYIAALAHPVAAQEGG